MAKMANQDIKSYAKSKGVSLWQIGDVKGVSECTIIRWLRHELPERDKAEFIRIIDELAVRSSETRVVKVV